MDQDKVLQEEEHKEERTLFNPELTFCEGKTYLDFLLSNAKDDDEVEQIKDTINNYLEVVDDEIKKDDE